MTSITLLYGQGSPNIGNSFFQLGGTWLIRHCWPQAELNFVSDMAGHMLPWRTQRKHGNPLNDANILSRLQTDVVVLQGPMLNRSLASLYGHALRSLKANGTKIFLLSAGMNKYDAEEEDVSKRFLSEIKPDLLVTRDRPTYDIFKDFSPRSHCGIDSAFYCPRAYKTAAFRDKFIAMSCDQTLEPLLEQAGKTDTDSVIAVTDDLRIKVSPRTGLVARLRRGGWAGKAAAWLIPMKYPTSFGSLPIIRPFHKSNPFVAPWIYQAPNTHASDEPYTYLNIYANTQVTITDRVHAAIITLAYGKPTLFLGRTHRSHLFEHVCPEVNQGKLARLDPAALRLLQDTQIAAMSTVSLS